MIKDTLCYILVISLNKKKVSVTFCRRN